MSTIAIDFDGVLSDYSGRYNPKELDPPFPGALDAIREYQDAGLKVCIYTTRADSIDSASKVERWLRKYGLEHRRIDQIQITNRKPPAIVYLDDRAWCFKGQFPSPEEILQFRTWQGY
jgi:hypothetical protein